MYKTKKPILVGLDNDMLQIVDNYSKQYKFSRNKMLRILIQYMVNSPILIVDAVKATKKL